MSGQSEQFVTKLWDRPLKASMTLCLWCHALLLWNFCQESMTGIWSWRNIRWTQLEAHSPEWKLFSMKLSGTGKAGKDWGIGTDGERLKRHGKWVHRWTPGPDDKKDSARTVGEIWLGSVDWYISIDFLTGRVIWWSQREHPCFLELCTGVLRSDGAPVLKWFRKD